MKTPKVRSKRSCFWVLVLALIGAASTSGAATASILEQDGFTLSGDFRARLESDFESQRQDGVAREDRLRLRARLRLNFEYSASEVFSLGMRLRSGTDPSHQSPHVTLVDFDGNDTGAADFNFDKWFIQVSGKPGRGWVGRNSLPFWKQNEFFWDDDVTPVGLGASFGWPVGGGYLGLNAGYFSPPVGMRAFAGNLAAAQVVWSWKEVTAAAGVLGFDADADDPHGALLLSGNGLRDYRILIASVQGRVARVTLGADVLTNDQEYGRTSSDPFAADNGDQTDGIVLSARYGSTREKGDWLCAWYYAKIEALAVNASYAGDDWVRWGSASETRASAFEGHELRFARALEENMNLVARLFLVEGIDSAEDGRRFRLDFNYSF